MRVAVELAPAHAHAALRNTTRRGCQQEQAWTSGKNGAGAGAAEVAFTLYVFVVFPSAAVTTITIVVFAPGVRGTALPAPPLTTLLPWIVIVALLLFKLAMICTLLRFAASGQV